MKRRGTHNAHEGSYLVVLLSMIKRTMIKTMHKNNAIEGGIGT